MKGVNATNVEDVSLSSRGLHLIPLEGYLEGVSETHVEEVPISSINSVLGGCVPPLDEIFPPRGRRSNSLYRVDIAARGSL